MWIQVAQNCCVNLEQAERVVVRAIKEPDLTLTDSPAPSQTVTRVDVEAYFPEERRYALASFAITRKARSLKDSASISIYRK